MQHTWRIKLVDNYCVFPWNKYDWKMKSVIPSLETRHLSCVNQWSNNILNIIIMSKTSPRVRSIIQTFGFNICGTFGTSELFYVVWNSCHQETHWRSSFGPELFLLGQTHEYSEESIKWRLCCCAFTLNLTCRGTPHNILHSLFMHSI